MQIRKQTTRLRDGLIVVSSFPENNLSGASNRSFKDWGNTASYKIFAKIYSD